MGQGCRYVIHAVGPPPLAFSSSIPRHHVLIPTHPLKLCSAFLRSVKDSIRDCTEMLLSKASCSNGRHFRPQVEGHIDYGEDQFAAKQFKTTYGPAKGTPPLDTGEQALSVRLKVASLSFQTFPRGFTKDMEPRTLPDRQVGLLPPPPPPPASGLCLGAVSLPLRLHRRMACSSHSL